MKEILLSDMEYTLFNLYLERRSNHEPIAKIIGYKEFYNSKFYTNSSTLDPRPETELIVDLFQQYYLDNNKHLEILDLGCGTGCIGLSILLLYPNATLHLLDISKDALNIAILNAKNLNVFDRCIFIQSNWFEKVIQQYDVIVSNPPYVSDIYKVDKEVLYDPYEALFAGPEGLDAYKIILPIISKYLKNNGKLLLEIGYDQYDKILHINTGLKLIQTAKDLNNINRVLVFQQLVF